MKGVEKKSNWSSFRPEVVLFRPDEAAPKYASAQAIDFLAGTKNLFSHGQKI
jgi:hypothetical protein